MTTGQTETMSSRVRARLAKRLSVKICPQCGQSERARAGQGEKIAEIGVNSASVYKFLAGHTISLDSVDKIVTWLDAQAEAEAAKKK